MHTFFGDVKLTMSTLSSFELVVLKGKGIRKLHAFKMHCKFKRLADILGCCIFPFEDRLHCTELCC